MESTMNKTVEDMARRWLKRTPAALSALEHRVLQSTLEHKIVAKNTNKTYETQQTFGDRTADGIARFGGSWSFILGFLGFLAVWTIANALLLGRDSFDPYPFIFLNLVLSMLAALQAPIIMMSQNRQATHDRIDAAHDYEVNLKAEIEIMALHDKLDELRHSELIGMRDDIARIARHLEDIAKRLPIPETKAAP
jgi:uncharacterized membrane protein